MHRAVVVSALAATSTVLLVPIAIAFVASIETQEVVLALAFGGVVAASLGPRVLLAADVARLAILGPARIARVTLWRRSSRACLGIGVVSVCRAQPPTPSFGAGRSAA